MKFIFFSFIVLGFMVGSIQEAQAVRCAAGVYRTGCVGPRGAAVYRHRYPHYGASRCIWRAGRRVCY